MVLVTSMLVSVAVPASATVYPAGSKINSPTSPGTTPGPVWLNSQNVAFVSVNFSANLSSAEPMDVIINIQKANNLIGTYTTTVNAPYNGTYSYQVACGGFGENTYDLHVLLRQPAGAGTYVETPFQVNAIGIDNTAPGLPIQTKPDNGGATRNVQPTFTWTAPAGENPPNTSPLHYVLEVSPSSSFSANVTTGTTADNALSWTLNSTSLPIGVTYYWHIKAIDAAGNTGNFTAPAWSFLVDQTPPTVNITSPSGFPAAMPSPQPTTIGGTAWDDLSGVAAVNVQFKYVDGSGYYWNGVAWVVDPTVSVPATVTLQPTSQLPRASTAKNYTWTLGNLPTLTSNREYLVTVWAVDFAGNSSIPVLWSFRYDTLNPTVTENSFNSYYGAYGGSYPPPTMASGTFSGITTSPSPDTLPPGAVNLQITRSSDAKYWDGAAWNATAPSPGLPAVLNMGNHSWTYTISGTPFNGDAVTYTVTAVATDSVGHNSTPATRTFIVDLSKPLAAVNQMGTLMGTDYYVNSLCTINGTASDATSGVSAVNVVIDIVTPPTPPPPPPTETPTISFPRTMSANYNSTTHTWSLDVSHVNFQSGVKYSVNATATDNVGINGDQSSSKTFYYYAAPFVYMIYPQEFNINLATLDPANPPMADDPAHPHHQTYRGPTGVSPVSGISFAWGPSAVTNVQVQFVNGTQYWNGSAWSATAIWLDATGSPKFDFGPGAATFNIKSWSYEGTMPTYVNGQTYTINARAANNAQDGSLQYSIAGCYGSTFTFIYDNTVPCTTLMTIPSTVTAFGEIWGTATDTGSGIGTIYVKFSCQAPAPDASEGDPNFEATHSTWTADYNSHTSLWTIDDYIWFRNNKAYTIKVWAVDRAGNDLTEACGVSATFTFVRTDDKVYLDKGWNFISFPRTLSANYNTFGPLLGNIPGVTAAYGYDAVSGWQPLSSNSPIKVLDGYWICFEGPDHVYTAFGFDYNAPGRDVPASKKLAADAWNAIGPSSTYGVNQYDKESETALAGTYDQGSCPLYVPNQLKSIEGSWSTLLNWDSEDQEYNGPIIAPGSHNHMHPGQGYWIWISNADGDTLSAISN